MKVQGEDTGETRIKKNKNKDIINVVFLPRKGTILLDRSPRENNCCTYKQDQNYPDIPGQIPFIFRRSTFLLKHDL